MRNEANTPDVSVVVPVYNVEAYLRSCLNSLASQTLQNIEVIMVNDGSTDSSPEIATEFENNYSNFKLVNQQNEGLSVARNTGIKHARGNYIGFVDSDDFVDHTMYETLYMTAVQRKADIVKSGVLLFNDASGDIQDFRRIDEPTIIYNSPGEALTAFLEKKMNIVVVNGIYEKDIFKDLTFTTGVTYEDHYFTPNALLRCQRFVQINAIHYYYRKREGSMTGRIDPVKRADKVRSLNELYRVLMKTGAFEEYAKSYSEYFAGMAKEYHHSVVYTDPLRLRRGQSALKTLINPEIIQRVLAKGHLSETDRTNLRLLTRSHGLFFLKQKLKRLLEIAGGGPKTSKVTIEQGLISENETLHYYRDYIEIYG